MAYPKGKARPEGAGRKAGTPNKATQDLHAICAEHGLDVFEALVVMACEEEDVQKRFDKMMRLAPYLYAQRKALELKSDEDSGFKIVIEDYRKDGE